MNRVLNTNLKLYCIILFTILFSTGCSTKTLDDIIKKNKNKKLTPVLPIINKAFNSNLMIDVG
jgi:PBP1b-binding outer membrane lipoprotein LpoB